MNLSLNELLFFYELEFKNEAFFCSSSWMGEKERLLEMVKPVLVQDWVWRFCFLGVENCLGG